MKKSCLVERERRRWAVREDLNRRADVSVRAFCGNSPTHRNSFMIPLYTEMGIGIKHQHVVMLLGRPQN